MRNDCIICIFLFRKSLQFPAKYVIIIEYTGLCIRRTKVPQKRHTAAENEKGTAQTRQCPETGELMKPRWLFFDYDSTLIDETAARLHGLADCLREAGITQEQFAEKRAEFAGKTHDAEGETIRFFGLPALPPHPEDETPYPETEEVVRTLYARGYDLGVVANSPAGLEKRLASWGLLQYFRTVIASGEIGVAKPDHAILLYSLQTAGVSPAHCVMIGDSLEDDIYPAVAMGIHTVWVRRTARAGQLRTNGKQPDHVIPDLNGLLELYQ